MRHYTVVWSLQCGIHRRPLTDAEMTDMLDAAIAQTEPEPFRDTEELWRHQGRELGFVKVAGRRRAA